MRRQHEDVLGVRQRQRLQGAAWSRYHAPGPVADDQLRVRVRPQEPARFSGLRRMRGILANRATVSDERLRWAEKARRLQFEQLDIVRRQAESWRSIE